MTRSRRFSGWRPGAMLLIGLCAQAPTMTMSPGTRLAFDFTAVPGGMPAGGFENFGFVVDVGRPDRKILMEAGRPDASAGFDYAGCGANQGGVLQAAVRGLPRGTPAFVDYIDIELAPSGQRDLTWVGGVCYGVRVGGEWRWNLASTPLVQDVAAGTVRARLWVKQPGVDAVKLVFDHSVPRLSVRSVLVTTQPERIDIVR